MGFSPPAGARRVAAAAALCFSCVIVAPSAAYADEAAAETFFQEGLAAMKRNDFPVACEAFTQSNKQDPSPGTQINLAVCYEKQKKWASAWTWYRSAVGLAQQRNQKEREQLAEDSANRIKKDIHYIVVVVKEPLTDLVVKRDGAEVAISVGGKEVPLPIDPGDHTLEVSARGKKTHTLQFKVAEDNKTDRIEIPKLEDAPVDEATPTPIGAREPTVAADGSGQRTVGIIIGGVGVLAGLTSLGVYILASNEASKRDERRIEASLLPPEQARPINDSADSNDSAAKNNQLISIITASGAAVLLGVGAFLFFTAPKGSGPPKRGLLPHPIIGPNLAGAGLGGTF